MGILFVIFIVNGLAAIAGLVFILGKYVIMNVVEWVKVLVKKMKVFVGKAKRYIQIKKNGCYSK